MSLKYNLKNLNTSTHIYFNPNKTESIDEIKTIIETNDYFILPNDSDINDTYQNLSEYILRQKEITSFLCKGISLPYIKDALEEADAIIAISSEGSNILPNGNIFGFALLIFNEKNNSVYIDVICSHVGIKYAGDALINSINYMCEILFITKIKLQSVNTAISFYEKYGFYKKGICDNIVDLCEMEKNVTKKSLGGKRRKTKKRRKNTKLTERVKK